MAMSFEDAVTNLQVMFPALDTGVIAAVLESNGGHMEHTVTQLLELDSTTGAASSPDKSAAPRKPPDVTSSADTSGVAVHDGRGAARPAASAPGRVAGAPRRWRNPLPDDFLQVPGANGPVVTTTGSSQLAQDQLIAQMLENELFLEELRRNPEFAEYLEAEGGFYDTGRASGHRHAAAGETGDGAGRGAPQPSWADRLSTVSGELKRKFNTLALRFKGARGGAEGGPPGQYRSLLADDDAAEETTISGGVAPVATHRRPHGELAGAGGAPAPATGRARGRTSSSGGKKDE